MLNDNPGEQFVSYERTGVYRCPDRRQASLPPQVRNDRIVIAGVERTPVASDNLGLFHVDLQTGTTKQDPVQAPGKMMEHRVVCRSCVTVIGVGRRSVAKSGTLEPIFEACREQDPVYRVGDGAAGRGGVHNLRRPRIAVEVSGQQLEFTVYCSIGDPPVHQRCASNSGRFADVIEMGIDVEEVHAFREVVKMDPRRRPDAG